MLRNGFNTSNVSQAYRTHHSFPDLVSLSSDPEELSQGAEPRAGHLLDAVLLFGNHSDDIPRKAPGATGHVKQQRMHW